MAKLIVNPIRMTLTLFLCFTMALISGCASGGFKLTRKYAQFINRQNILIRIILYILTTVVFAVTMLVDMVIFNTADFWQGRVSAGDFQFIEGDKTFHVRHEILPDTLLKRSTIQVLNNEEDLLQTVVLKENSAGEIELFVDGVLRTKVKDIYGLPIASLYNAEGVFTGDKLLLIETSIPQVAESTR